MFASSTSRSSPARSDGPLATASKRHSLLARFRIRSEIARCLSDPARGADLIEGFADRLRGFLPDKAAEGVVMAACDDRYYARFAVTLLLSLERLGAKQAFHLHLLRPSRSTLDHIGALRSGLHHVELSWTEDACFLAEGMTSEVIYFTSARFLMMHRLLSELGRPLLCLDVDGIALRPPWPAYDALRTKGDVGLIFRPAKRKAWQKVHAAAVGQNPTEAGLCYSSLIARSLALLCRQDPAYHIDQIALHYAALEASKHIPGIRFFDIPQNFADYEFRDDAVIATPKGWGMKSSDRYESMKQEVEALFPAVGPVGEAATAPPSRVAE